MTTGTVDTAEVALVTEGYRTELGFAMLALAQLVSFFGVWFGYWPTSFGMSGTVGRAFAVFFVGCGVVGFYLAFRALSTA